MRATFHAAVHATTRAVRHGGEWALFWAGLLLFGASCLAWSVLAGVLHRFMRPERGVRLGQRGIMAGFRAYLGVMQALGTFRCDLRALDALRDAGPLVIVANHPSLLDAVVVISRLPRVVCVAKASLWNNPIYGGSVRLAGYIRNDGPHVLVRNAVGKLRDGQQLLIFPEGTRTEAPPVNAFRGGFLLVARNAGVPVQTVLLEHGSAFLGKGWPLFRKPPVPVVITARLGRRFHVGDDVHETLAEMERYFREELAPQRAPARDPCPAQ